MSNWYMQSGNDSDVIVSTCVKISRNINGFEFENKMSEDSKKELLEKIVKSISNLEYNLELIKIKELDNISRNSLVEKGIINREYLKGNVENKAILLNDDENIAILINGTEHLLIEVFSSGEEIKNVSNLALEIDSKIESVLPYAYNDKYGFLTSNIYKVGTGMNIYVSCHMPGLVHTGNIDKMITIINKFNMSIENQDSKTSDIYTICNNQTIGISEKEIEENMYELVDKIIKNEKMARDFLGKDRIELENNIYRAFGTLKYARILKLDEAQTLISDVKMGTDMGVISELDDKKIMKLLYYSKPYNLQKYYNKQMNNKEIAIKRCEIINDIIDEKI